MYVDLNVKQGEVLTGTRDSQDGTEVAENDRSSP